MWTRNYVISLGIIGAVILLAALALQWSLPPSRHVLSVHGGFGSGLYAKGERVAIVAPDPAPGSRFAGWVPPQYVDAPFSAKNAVVTMPDVNVDLAATYDTPQPSLLPLKERTRHHAEWSDRAQRFERDKRAGRRGRAH